MEIIRDPLWNNIRLDDLALALVDTPVVQRLRYVRQLGLAYLVYPGATHSRFEHALGAYHLSGVALRLLHEGVEHARFEGRYGAPMSHFFADELNEGVTKGLIDIDDARVQLTERGRFVSNQVMKLFV